MQLQSMHRRHRLAFEGQVEGAKQAMTGTRSSLTLQIYTGRPLFSVQKKKRKSRNRTFLRDCLFVHFAMDAEPPGKRPCARQTTLFGQVVGKNDDNVRSHLPNITPNVDHTFVSGGREGVKCRMKFFRLSAMCKLLR